MTRRSILLALLSLLAGCATFTPSEAPVSDKAAVVSFVAQARADIEGGRLDEAGTSLERAMRIEPRNPALWHELARLRLYQAQYEQAESLAMKSNTLAGNNNGLLAQNWRIIEQARTQRGDGAGAHRAYERAQAFEGRAN